MTKKIYRNSLFVLIPVAALSAFFEWQQLPLSILIGGLLGIANMKGLAWGVEGIFGSTKASGPMIAFSLFRISLLIIIVALLLYMKLVNIIGILIGFTIIFIMTLVEGFKYAKNLQDK
jgi:hypothetical protein